MRKIIVVGAGASGLMAAIAAAGSGAAVTVLEGMEKPGKKILVTGNGRCNLTNTNQQRKDRYRGASGGFVDEVMEQFTAEDTIHFFEKLGLLLQEKEGYIYPYVNQASAVLEVLLLEARRLGVKIKCSEKVVRLEQVDSGWKVHTSSWCYECDAVILSAGSKAAPVTGSDGSGYELAGQLGHSIITPMEALVPLKAKEKWIKRLSGIRMPAKVTLITEDGRERKVYEESGELQWTDYGISGIVVFQLSRYGVRALAEKKSVTAVLDLLPGMTQEALCQYLNCRNRFGSAEEFFTGLLPKKAIPVLLEMAGIKPSAKADSITEKQMQAMTERIKKLAITIIGSKSFDAAQVCSGGVDTAWVDAQTLESRRKRGLYFSGELLDVDGICGGYNLQWAWSSGYVAGKSAAGKE